MTRFELCCQSELLRTCYIVLCSRFLVFLNIVVCNTVRPINTCVCTDFCLIGLEGHCSGGSLTQVLAHSTFRVHCKSHGVMITFIKQGRVFVPDEAAYSSMINVTTLNVSISNFDLLLPHQLRSHVDVLKKAIRDEQAQKTSMEVRGQPYRVWEEPGSLSITCLAFRPHPYFVTNIPFPANIHLYTHVHV